MSVMPGLRDRRLVFYTPADGGADGFQRTVYVKSATVWGRIDDTASNEAVPLQPQAHVEQRQTATATVADSVAVPIGGICHEDGQATRYHIRGVVPKRAVRCQDVTLEAIAAEAMASYAVYDAVDVLDGTHLVTPNGTFQPLPAPVAVRGFGIAFNTAFG